MLDPVKKNSLGYSEHKSPRMGKVRTFDVAFLYCS